MIRYVLKSKVPDIDGKFQYFYFVMMGQHNSPNLTSVRGYAHEFSSHAAAKEWLSPFFDIVEVAAS